VHSDVDSKSKFESEELVEGVGPWVRGIWFKVSNIYSRV
jgi:hypothetical protein